ncbi:MAG: hypothetical protein WCJ59_02810, partial [bacterium]
MKTKISIVPFVKLPKVGVSALLLRRPGYDFTNLRPNYFPYVLESMCQGQFSDQYSTQLDTINELCRTKELAAVWSVCVAISTVLYENKTMAGRHLVCGCIIPQPSKNIPLLNLGVGVGELVPISRQILPSVMIPDARMKRDGPMAHRVLVAPTILIESMEKGFETFSHYSTEVW